MEEEKSTRAVYLLFACIGAFNASVISALIWASITVLAEIQVGFMAVGVGGLVAVSIRHFWRGNQVSLRVVGAVFAVFGCLLGNVLSQTGFYARENEIMIADAVLGLNPSAMPGILIETTQGIDFLFYALAVFEAVKFSVTAKVGASHKDGARFGFWQFNYPFEKVLLSAVPLVLIVSGCLYFVQAANSYKRYFYESGRIQYEGKLQWNKAQGVWKYWYDNGRLMAEISYADGFENGVTKRYYDDGSLYSEEFYASSMRHNDYVEYHRNGNKSVRGRYEYDRKTGEWVYYHENGELRQTGRYYLDNPHGQWKIYHETGALSQRGSYDHGKLSGPWYIYDEDEKLIEIAEYGPEFRKYLLLISDGREVVQDGKGVYRKYHANGQLSIRGSVRYGLPVGVWEEWYHTGSLEKTYVLENGKQRLQDYWDRNSGQLVRDGQGTIATYHDNGNQAAEAHYENGVLTGEFKYWYEDGAPSASLRYIDGVLDGEAKYYSATGVIITGGRYENGNQEGKWVWRDENDGQIISEVKFVKGLKNGTQTFYKYGALVREEVYESGQLTDTVVH